MTQQRYCCVRISSVCHRSKVLTEEVGLQQVHPAKVAGHGRVSCWLAKLCKIVIILLPCLTPLKASLILAQVVSKSQVPTIRDYKVSSSLVVIFLPSPPTDTLDHTLQSLEKQRMSCMHAWGSRDRSCSMLQRFLKKTNCTVSICILPDLCRLWFWMILMLNDAAWTATPGCTQVFQLGWLQKLHCRQVQQLVSSQWQAKCCCTESLQANELPLQ